MDCILGAGDRVVPIKITVVQGNNLVRGNKSDSLLNFVRAEFNGVALGDSQKLEASADQAVGYNFAFSIECSEATNTLDDVAHRPVILTVVEILPKEKKQKEDKTAVLGQAVVDLIPLLQGQCNFTTTVLLNPTPGSSVEAAAQEGSNKPSLDVTVQVPEPLLSDTQLSDSNLLKVTVETAFCVPDVWNPPSGSVPPSTYVAALQVPLIAEKEQILLFTNGLLKLGGEKEPPSKLKRWPLGPMLAPGAQFIHGSSIEVEPIEQEDGELTAMEERDFRLEAETIKKRVSWDTERRCFLDTSGAACLTRRIAESRLWPVEFMRSHQTAAAKGAKAGKPQAEDDSQIMFHGVAYVDMAPLLYPGAKRIRGAYRIHPFYDADVLAKAKRTVSVLRENAKAGANHGKGRTNSSLGTCKAAPSKVFDVGHKGAKEPKEPPKKPGTQGKPAATESLLDLEPLVNVEGQMYTDARTYVIIEIALEKSLVPKRPPEELAKRVMELVPLRPPLPRRPAGAERAVQEYHSQIASVAGQLLEQYQQLFGAAFLPGAKPLDPGAQEQRKTLLLGELNYTGKYFAFKEQMKYCVVRIVREKMLRTEAFTDPQQMQAFLSQLYVFLVDEMHKALNKTLSEEAQETPLQPMLNCSQLRHFAREAQLNGDYQLAAQYYQEKLTRDRSDPSHWFDYGTFYMLTSDYVKADECFRQAVSIQQTHQPSLLMCGVLSEMAGRYAEAETFFEGATCIDPASVVAWTLFGLYYQGQDNSIQAEMAFLEASKQLRAMLTVASPPRTPAPQAAGVDTFVETPATEEPGEAVSEPAATATDGGGVEKEGDRMSLDNSEGSVGSKPGEGSKAPSDPESAASHHAPPLRLTTTIYMVTVEFLLENNALQMAQRALAQELLCPEGGLSSCYHQALARLQLLRQEYSSAEASLREALNESFQNPNVWAFYGHLCYLTGKYREAQKCYERTLDFANYAADTHPIYLRLGSIYLKEGKFEKAKMTYLRACKSSPSCLTWLGLGITCFRLGELTEAEDALTEANTLNNANPEVWAYLSLVSLQTGRRLEAEQSFKYVIKLNLQNESILKEIEELQKLVGFGNPCF